MANRQCLKLFARYIGLYQIFVKIGAVAYKLLLPVDAKIHPVFHVSQLKQHVGSTKTQSQLPLLDDQGLLVKEPICIL